jgi:hypothetical protein
MARDVTAGPVLERDCRRPFLALEIRDPTDRMATAPLPAADLEIKG